MVFKELEKFIQHLNVETITEDRKKILQPLLAFIRKKNNLKEKIRISFICTHNSRRSHFTQIWAQTLAHYFVIENVFCYSAGTTSTALFPLVAETLGRQGFRIQKLSENQNPIYSIKYSENEPSVIGFSKVLDNDFNPKSNFAAVMTCTQANEMCPFVPGAEIRIPIPYEDPKKWDHLPHAFEKYFQISQQIATEMWYVFSQIKS